MKSLMKLQNQSKEELIQELIHLQKENAQLQNDLAERKRKFQILVRICSLMESDNLTLEEIIQKTVDLIPSGCQYPEITFARVVLDKKEYKSSNFKTSKWKQSEVIPVGNKFNGTIEVFYSEQKPGGSEGLFLEVECGLLKIIADKLGKIVTYKLLKKEIEVVFEESPVAKCIIDLNNNYRFFDVNNVFLNLTGYSRKEIIGKRPTKIGLFKDIQIVKKMLGDIDRQGYIENLEYEYITKNGLVKSTILNTRVIHLNGRSLAVTSFIDLTEIKKTQKELRKTEARYRSLVQNQSDIILRSDFDGNLTFTNNSFNKTFGLNEKNIKDHNFMNTVFKEDVPSIVEAIDSIKQPPNKRYLEIRNNTVNGIRWFGWNNMAVVDETGTITEFQGVGRDITERIRSEEKIHESENRFQLIAKSVSDVIWVYNLTQKKFTYISPSVEKLRGYKGNEAVQQSLAEMLPADDYKQINHIITENERRIIQGSKTPTIVSEVQLRKKDGGFVWAEISAEFRKNGSDEVEIFGVSRNIDKRKRAEQKVQEHQIQLNSALKIAGLGYYLVSGIDAKVEFVDERTKDILGIIGNEEKPFLETWLHRIHANDRDLVIKTQNEVHTEKKDTIGLVYRYIHPERGMIWINHNIEILQRKKNDQTLKVFGVIQDITDLKRKEDELIEAKQKAEKNETQLKESQAMAKLGSWEFDIETGIFTFTDNFYKIFKTSTEEMGGYQMTIKEYADRFVHPDDFYLIEEESKKAIETDDPNYTTYIEHRIKYSDGGTGNIGVRIFIKKDGNGKTIKGYGVNQDITDRKINEQELVKAKEKAEESEMRFRTIAEQTTEGITVADLEGNYVYVNNAFCEMSGYSKEELLQMTVFDMGSKNVKQDNEVYYREENVSGQKRNALLCKKDGTDYQTEITGTFIEINKQKLVLGAIRDISKIVNYQNELIAAKEKAEESDRLKSSFLMNVSHEIRTPMNGILGFIDLLNEPDLEEEERRMFIDTVNKSGERLLNTINDIVEISKIEIGDINLVFEEVDASELMKFHYNFFKVQAERKGVQLKITEQIIGQKALIKTDKQKLDGILMNLIRNAIKFTNEGTIEIGNYLEEGKMYFYINDTGRGIPEDKLDVIFDRFVQAELGNTRGYEGSGIGLSIVKAYLEALNGDIRVKSKLGKGSTFLFSVPYSQAKAESPKAEVKEQQEITDGKYTLLVAEDDDVNYYFLEQILSKKFKLIHAESGEEAIQLFNDNPQISLVLMDIKMPGEYDGLEATRKIRKNNKDVPIIAQTAYATESDKIKALEAGCSDYISKPYSPVNLNALIRKFCGMNTERN